ncbi:HAMP domain-containing sensor histidine kinase [Lentibacillus sp. N15]|uniref:HAMP domain-containing sensor histidine kinase n=1 Tax=Lentibacillus songyuanensis TaxID=3136161 RepID=UPI0031BB3211
MKKFSHAILTKLVVFIIVILCFTGAIHALAKVMVENDGHVGIIFEDNYFHSMSYIEESEGLVNDLTTLLGEYKNEDNVLKGNTIDEDDLRFEEEDLFSNYLDSEGSGSDLSQENNFEQFKKEHADKIDHVKKRLINDELRVYHYIMQNIEDVKQPLYYASDGKNVYTNSKKLDKKQLQTYPSYIALDENKREFYPKDIEANRFTDRITGQMDQLDSKSHVYIAFPEEYLQSKIKDWQANKAHATKNIYQFIGFLAGFIVSFFYLVIVSGRKPAKEGDVHMHAIDALYVDINIAICIGLITVWIALLDVVAFYDIPKIVIPITIPISAAGFVLFYSLIRHIKKRTFFKHTLIYQIVYWLARFVKRVYDNGNIAVKTVLIVIGYPLLIAATFFMFPITIGIAAWFALKKVQSFHKIKDGVEKIKNGDIHHRIDVGEKGEFAELAANINRISDGVKYALDNELKSERLKTELITNVSHDIRTPLTSIITYVDLLKTEEDPLKAKSYIEVLDKKSKRLQTLTDNLFEAAKASSGNIPVHLEQIDIVSLITQGLGEVADKIDALNLDFKFHYPNDKVYILADGNLLWRSIENLLSNIFKYALQGSRVYVDIEDDGDEILLTFKNISAYELNVTPEELMERFKRGDDSRSSQGSGLGLSITRELIELQKGRFMIQIDGDLFKAMIYVPKVDHGD